MSTNFRYSEAFKLQVIREIEEGRFASATEASEAYGIRGHETVTRWLRQSGRGVLVRKMVRVEKPGEPGEIKRLKDRVRQLESALADSYIDGALSGAFFEILCEQTGTDAEAFKKKTRWDGAHRAHETIRDRRGVNVERLCKRVGMTRQNYYKRKTSRGRKAVDDGLVVELVRRVRQRHPRMGTRKLYHVLKAELGLAGVKIGRDRFFGILREHDLLVGPLPKAPNTTNSKHCLPVFRNLIAELVTNAPLQVWVSDITYLRTMEDFEYLSLIMDLHSHKIVGFHCGDDLSTAGCMKALEMALDSLPDDARTIHHSDRGCQYCSHEYVNRLTEAGLSVSMTEENHCAENSVAERLNGILKQEYVLGATFQTRAQARAAVLQAVMLYNSERPHMSLGMQTPDEVHKKAA